MRKKALKIVLFLVLGVSLFFAVQRILTPNWNNYQGSDSSIQGFFALEDDTLVVLFLGTSHVIYGISPMRLYEQTGIRSYNLGTSGQPIECSYILLKQAFCSQHPKVVFLDVSHMFDDKTKMAPYYRNVMDNLYGRSTYWEFAKIYAETDKSDGFWSAIFPMIKYHTRWTELDADDLSHPHGVYYSMGQYIHSYAGSPAMSLASLEQYNAKVFSRGSGTVLTADGDADQSQVQTDPIYHPQITATFTEYVEKMLALCRENGAELIMMNVPTMKKAVQGGWSTVKAEAAAAFMEQYGLTFVDLHYADIVDPTYDFIDGGGHLNLNGSEKVMDYLGDFLSGAYPTLPSLGTQNDQFEAALEKYRMVRRVAQIEMEPDLRRYLSLLDREKDRVTILISSKSNYISGLTEADFELLRALGLELADSANYQDTYLAVIRNGKVGYEAVSDRRLTYTKDLGEISVEMTTGSAYEKGASQITIDGTNYSLNKRGLNIVVWDNETNLPIDCVNFDTGSESRAVTRSKGTVGKLIRAYEEAIQKLPDVSNERVFSGTDS